MIRHAAIWVGLAAATVIPLWLAGLSPLLAWRDPIYIAAGFSGIVALTLLLFQPLLAGRLLPNVPRPRQRKLHRAAGFALVFAIIAHVAGLWLTSPPDVIDALTFTSPTPFSIWGVLAMWAVFGTALLAIYAHKIKPTRWRLIHKSLAIIIVAGTIAHAVLIEGTMETVSKWMLCMLVAVVTIKVIFVPKR